MQTRSAPVTICLALAATALAGLTACGQPTARVKHGDEAPEAFAGQARLRELWLEEDGFLVSPTLTAPELATRVAVWLSTSEDAGELPLALEARGFDVDGVATAWRPVQFTWRDGVQRVGRLDLGRLVDAVEVRVPLDQSERIAGIVYSAVVPEVAEGAAAVADAEGIAAGEAGVGEHALDIAGIEPRSAWGARASGGCSSNTTKTKITVHHSVSALLPNGTRAQHAAAVRGIQAYHMDGRGYCDMGYHFAATADGTVWEGREARFLGAHTGNNNTNNAGIVFIGCFHPTSDCNGLGGLNPTTAQMNGGGAAIGRIAQHYGINIGTSTVIGHRDNPGQTTACPGNNLHAKLGELRTIANGGGSAPPPPPTTGKVQGVVWDLSVTTDAAQSESTGARRPGARISVSGNGATAQPATAREGDSYWSFNLNPGTYTFTATLDGYAPASREVQVSSGANLWASIGISPVATALDLTVRVVDVDTGTLIEGATVTVTGADPAQTNGDGEITFNLGAGDVSITASAEGYVDRTINESLVAGAPVTIDVALTAVEVEDKPDDEIEEPEGPGDGDPEGPPLGPASEVERVTILPPLQTAGGCSAMTTSSTVPGVAIVALAFALRRRRAR